MAFETFGGNLNRSIGWHGASAIDISYSSLRRCRRHAHDRAFFSFLITGAYEENFAKTRSLKHCPGAVVFHPVDTIHSDCIDANGTRFLLLSLSGPWLDIAPLQCRREQQPFLCQESASMIMSRLYARFQQDCDPLFFEEAIIQLLSSMRPPRLPASPRKSRWLERVVELVHAEFASSLTLASIAEQMNLHPAYLSRSFRSVYGQNLGDYIKCLRISRAALKMTTTDMSLTEIAHATGFADHSHLTRSFKQIKGVTPSKYRESLPVAQGNVVRKMAR